MRHSPERPLPYSKVCNLTGDAEQLAPYLESLDRFPDVMHGQQAVRKWEYAMALRVVQGWQQEQVRQVTQVGIHPLHICDVGGAGGFHRVLATLTTLPITVIDPAIDGLTVEARVEKYPHAAFDVLLSISVIEHVAQVKHFFRACHTLLKPGGLLFFTTDYWDAEGPDTAHFHWMRQRIYNAGLIRKLLVDLREVGFQSFGQADWSYHGHQIYGYSVCAVAMTKKGPV